MKDFIGNEIKPGDFVAKGAKGNVDAEYGMIAYRVLSLSPSPTRGATKISVERLTVHYPQAREPGVVKLRKTTISNWNAVLVFTPTAKILQLFEDARLDRLSDEDRILIGKWIHGSDFQTPWEEISQ